MSYVITLRLAAPLQAWGASSRFSRRMSERAPTKSGVIGLIAAALGLARTDSLERFSALRYGVRADQPGSLLRDFHTAHDASGASMPLSQRYYLQDAVFLAGLESDDRELLESFARALRHPHFPIFLGRRSCPPDGPIVTQTVEGDLETVLREAPWAGTARHLAVRCARHDWSASAGIAAELLIEPRQDDLSGATAETLADEPVSFDPERRRYATRRIRRLAPVEFASLTPTDVVAGSAEVCDPFETVLELESRTSSRNSQEEQQ
ncbi:type I-E CRISPR-associated protein Cas5/CasD [Pseudoclavibacter sp. CFCC 13611]|uniref:type I-E CRISPR-associated protein Cas5/CasD n=1 Tax=Pseudoclavibacter sp. CFCC 13611 TaxID=2615178 RepID=UPI0013016009|nr:type I-E CRISPR-associated protein Cas5/CasD [Pseudoclavibacter sp. CFCC 13611]KAB1662976.1 type I-E CRISPR-associated protein Cas5/CasD [Pseudoclavibacter sp. CFCC 13611]